MSKLNINSVLIVIGFVFLLIGFFMDQKGTLDFQLEDTYLVTGKAQMIRTLGILTVLNGLVYALFDRLRLIFNRRIKYFGITLFFLSLIIVVVGLLVFSQSNGLSNGSLISLNQNGLSVLVLLAGMFTLLLSLFSPLVIWISILTRKYF